MNTKICFVCNEEKEITEFYSKMRRCKVCHNKKAMAWNKANPEKVQKAKRKWRASSDNRKKEVSAARRWQLNNPERFATQRLRTQLKGYGLTIDQYEEMKQAQNGNCFICGRLPTRRLDVDHNHMTGEIRKLLCINCNTLIGLCGESIDHLQKVIAYLQAHNSEQQPNVRFQSI